MAEVGTIGQCKRHKCVIFSDPWCTLRHNRDQWTGCLFPTAAVCTFSKTACS